VTSRYCPMVRVKDSSIAFPNTAKTSRNTATYVVKSGRDS
jgi:hypothetical protein